MKALVLLIFLLYNRAAKCYRVNSGHRHNTVPHHEYRTSRPDHHTYPHSNGLSGNSNGQYGHGNQRQEYHHREVHHHYHYNPPQQVSYGATTYPVYQHSPPTYVYQYRESGSRFDTLLTGLALYNLGRMSSNNHNREYSSRPYETCKMGIKKANGDYEESRIDCKLMSSFIWETESSRPVATNTVVTSTKNVTTVVNTNNNGSSVSTTTVENKTVVDALQVKGPSITVTPGMTCYMIRSSRDSSVMRKTVECGVLQAYARDSLRYSGALGIHGLSYTWILYLTLLLTHIF